MMRVSPLKAGLSSRIKAGTNPVTMVDPTGLDIRVLEAVPYLNPRAGGPIYMPSGWKSYPTYDAFVAGVAQAAREGKILPEIIIEGHALYNQMGCNQTDQNSYDGGAIIYNPKLKDHPLQIYTESKKWVDFESLHLKELGVRKITLRGCGTAGGYPDSWAPEMAKKTGYPLDYVTNRTMYPVTDDNITAAISDVTGATVTGTLGPGAKGFGDWSAIPTRTYQNGVPLDGPLR